jgi:hypothetical protein
MSTAPITKNLSAQLAKAVAAALQRPGSDFKPQKVEDLGGQLCRLEVHHGSQRTPGAHYSVVDTERIFAITVSEIPKDQRP